MLYCIVISFVIALHLFDGLSSGTELSQSYAKFLHFLGKRALFFLLGCKIRTFRFCSASKLIQSFFYFFSLSLDAAESVESLSVTVVSRALFFKKCTLSSIECFLKHLETAYLGIGRIDAACEIEDLILIFISLSQQFIHLLG